MRIANLAAQQSTRDPYGAVVVDTRARSRSASDELSHLREKPVFPDGSVCSGCCLIYYIYTWCVQQPAEVTGTSKHSSASTVSI